MARFLARNIAKFILLMLAVSLVTFVLVSVSPIDPVQANVGQTAYINMSEAKRAQLAEYWGVNTPLWERYANWFVDLLHGDLGTSLRFNAPVIDVIATRAVNSLALMATAWAVSGVLGFALGILAGANRGRLIDRIVKGYCFLLASVPTFWLGLLFLIVFSVQLGWFPFGFSVPIGVSAADVTFADALHHLALPALTLSVIGVAIIALHTREKTIDVLVRPCARVEHLGRPAPPRPAQPRAARAHVAIRVHIRDIRRIGAGGAGILLSGSGAGGRHGRPRRRRGAVGGHRAILRRLRVHRQPDSQHAVRRGGSPHAQGGCSWLTSALKPA